MEKAGFEIISGQEGGLKESVMLDQAREAAALCEGVY